MTEPLQIPQRTLMGPGPSDVAPSVMRALSQPTIGHLDPRYLAAMDEIQSMLRQVIGTANPATFAISGTGSSGMEACLVNLVEPRDRVLIGVNGYFGGRLSEVARRCGAEVVKVEGTWGRALVPDDYRKTAAGGKFKILCVVHGETSTGVLHDLAGYRAVADELGALLLVDAVTTLGAVPVDADANGIDALYSCSQKGLGCPPGLSPVTFSERAMRAVAARKSPVASFYLDAQLLMQYWGKERVYHHTAPCNLYFALHEALRVAIGEGLPVRFQRHQGNAAALGAGLEGMGLKLLVPPSERLPCVTTVEVLPGIDEAKIRRRLLDEYDLEIGGGLGPLKGKIWRIGLMGAGSTKKNIALCLSALSAALNAEGYRVSTPVPSASA